MNHKIYESEIYVVVIKHSILYISLRLGVFFLEKYLYFIYPLIDV